MNEVIKDEIKKVQKLTASRWVPEIDQMLKDSYEILMHREIMTFDYIAIGIIGEQSAWNLAMFEKYFSYLESFKSHVNNLLVALLPNKTNQSFDAIELFGLKVNVEHIGNKNTMLVYKTAAPRANAIDIFEVDYAKYVIDPEFVASLKSRTGDFIANNGVIDVFGKFLLGKNKVNNDQELKIFNLSEGLVRLNSLK